jgi:hypothetical protein
MRYNRRVFTPRHPQGVRTALNPPYPELDEILDAIGEAGARLSDIKASEEPLPLDRSFQPDVELIDLTAERVAVQLFGRYNGVYDGMTLLCLDHDYARQPTQSTI